jgi:hypothetical protein
MSTHKEPLGAPQRAQPRSWLRSGQGILFLALAACALGLGLVGYLYRVHILWRYSARRIGLVHVQRVPVAPMPRGGVSSRWVRCRFGSLEFHLPEEMANDPEPPSDGASMLRFRDGSRELFVRLPMDLEDPLDRFRDGAPIPPEADGLSSIQLLLLCYRTGSDDFRWSMTPREVDSLAWRLAANRSFRLGSERQGETVFHDDLEGVALFGVERATLQWEAAAGRIGGYLNFTERTYDGEIDPAWVRSVCQSLRFSGGSFPRQMPKEKLLGLYRVVSHAR